VNRRGVVLKRITHAFEFIFKSTLRDELTDIINDSTRLISNRNRIALCGANVYIEVHGVSYHTEWNQTFFYNGEFDPGSG
jgi:hypothetical protein